MQNDLFPDQVRKIALAQSFTGGDRTVKPSYENKASKNYRRGHGPVIEVAIKYGNDACKVYGVAHKGKDLSGGELNRKRGGAVGMMEGWLEIINEPVRQRVGLAGMAASYRVD